MACAVAGIFMAPPVHRAVAGDAKTTTKTRVSPLGPSVCSPGYFSATGTAPCDPARAGYYVDMSGSTSDIACPLGAYQPLTGQSGCLPASLGYYVSMTGSITDTECPSGKTTTAIASVACETPSGSIPSFPQISWWGEENPAVPGHKIWFVVSGVSGLAGTYDLYEGGEFPTSGTPLISVTVDGLGGGVNKDAITSADVTSSTRFSLRFTSSNSSWVSRDFKRRVSVCGVGRYSSDGNGPCTLAPAGGYVALSGQTFWSACSPGTFQANPGQSICEFAPPGSYTDAAQSTSAQLCSAGFYQPESNQTSCLPADIGYFVATDGSISQTLCPAGLTNDSTGQSSCTIPVPTTTTTTSTTIAPASTTSTTAVKRTPRLPVLVKKIKVGRTARIVLKKGRTVEGLVAKVSSKSKTCKVTRTSKGYSIRGLKRGRCRLSLSVTGNASFSSVNSTGSITIS